MVHTRHGARSGLCALVTASAMLLAVPAASAVPSEDSPGVSGPRGSFALPPLPAGLACDFTLGVSGTGGVEVLARSLDPETGTGTAISAGTGSRLTFTNLDDPTQTLTTRSNGAVSRTTVETPGGMQTVANMGHNVIILFPSDVPAGPSTTLYVGRVVYTIDPSGVFTIVSASGRTVDICAALES